MSKAVIFEKEAKERLLSGINILSNAVAATMGVGGRNVIFRDEFGSLRSTKDGVTVAKQIDDLEDPVMNMGAELVKNAAIKTASIAGDGTTTATVLTQYLANKGMEAVSEGNNAVDVKRGMEFGKEFVTSILQTMKTDIRQGTDDLLKVATLSANGDDVIGKFIAEAVDYVGLDGIVTVEDSKYGTSSRLEKVDGMQFTSGHTSTSIYFVTDTKKNQAVLETKSVDKEPLVFIHETPFTSDPKECLAIVLEYAIQEVRPILIVAPSFGDQVLSTMIINKTRGNVQCVPVTAPYYQEWQSKFMKDLAVMTGTKVFNPNVHNFDFDDVTDFLGSARRIVVKSDETIVIDAKGNKDEIFAHLADIKYQIEESDSDYRTEKEQNRMAQITGKVAIYHVGGFNDVERLEAKDRAEDALYATYSALEDGILPGGGTALLRVLNSPHIYTQEFSNESKLKGFKILLDALKVPFHKILSNAGIEEDKIQEASYKVVKDLDTVFDPIKEDTVNAFDSGIIDPFKVTKTALEHAVATAGMILLSEAVIFTTDEKKRDIMGELMAKV